MNEQLPNNMHLEDEEIAQKLNQVAEQVPGGIRFPGNPPSRLVPRPMYFFQGFS